MFKIQQLKAVKFCYIIDYDEIFRIRSHDESGTDIREKEVNLSTSNYFFAVHWWLRWVFLLDQWFVEMLSFESIFSSSIKYLLLVFINNCIMCTRKSIENWKKSNSLLQMISFNRYIFVNEFDLLFIILILSYFR